MYAILVVRSIQIMYPHFSASRGKKFTVRKDLEMVKRVRDRVKVRNIDFRHLLSLSLLSLLLILLLLVLLLPLLFAVDLQIDNSVLD